MLYYCILVLCVYIYIYIYVLYYRMLREHWLLRGRRAGPRGGLQVVHAGDQQEPLLSIIEVPAGLVYILFSLFTLSIIEVPAGLVYIYIRQILISLYINKINNISTTTIISIYIVYISFKHN